MNRIRLALVAFLALATAAIAADRREERPATGFHAVAMAINMNLEVIQDGTESLTLEGDPDVLADVETFVRDGTLDFRYRRDSRMRSHKRINAVVHARDMDAIALSGSGNLRSRALKADALTLSISGSGDVDIGQVTASKASLSISGSGNMKLAGRADALAVRISGSGDIAAPKLETQRTEVSISGSGRATVWAKRELATAISGAGTVRYYGDPTVAKAVRGIGHIERVAANP